MTRAWTEHTAAEVSRRRAAKWNHASPSQIETASLCLRKWYFGSVMNLPRPDSAAAQLGKQVHAEIEAYSKLEIGVTQLGYLSRKVHEAGLIPTPGTSIPEYEIADLVIGGVPIVGFVDDIQQDEDGLLITDWKTRSRPEFAKDETQLELDTQANVYSMAIMQSTGAREARFRHVNIGTRVPYSVAVAGPITIEKNRAWLYIQDVVYPKIEVMKVASLAKSPFDVTPNWKACSAFGGCPFKDKCAAGERVANLSTDPKEDTSMSAKDELMARLKKTEGTSKKTEPETKVRPPDAPASGAKAALLARLENGKTADVTKGAPETPKATESPAGGTAAGTDRKPRKFAESLGALGYDEKQIARMLPAEMHRAINEKIEAVNVSVSKDGRICVIEKTPVLAPKDGIADPDLTDLDACVKYAADALGWDASDDGELDKMPDEMLVFVCEKKIARGTVDVKFGEDGKIEDIEEKPASPAPERAALLQAGAAEGLVLYVGCRPVKGAHAALAIPLEDYLAPLAAAVAKDAKVEHYGLIEYAGGAPRVAALVLRDVPKGVFVVNPWHPLSNVVLESLRPLADAVIVVG